MSNTTPTWQNTTLNDYLYKDGNIPAGWEAFFNNADILLLLEKIRY